MTDTRQALAAPTEAQVLAAARMLCKIHAGQCQVDEDDTWKVYGEQFKDDARDALIAALSAQPVAGAVAEPDCWAILTPNGSKLVSPDEAKGRKDAYPLYAAPQPQAAPAPEPSRLQKMREAGFTARDTRLTCDECGAKFTPQFAPLHECAQPAPSAQGEPVATVTEEMVTAYLTANDAYWKRIDGEPTKLGKWRNGTPSEATRVSLMAALASAPSTPPPAVVEAVPLEWTEELGPMPGTPYNHCAASTPFGRFLITWKGWKENDWPTVDETPWGDFFGSWRTVKEAQAACEAEYAIRLLRGIAPKAAQPVEGER